jgi:hypothetical protein
MNIKVHKITKNNSHREEAISGKNISFGAGHSVGFWWNIHFKGKDKNGLSCDVEIQINEDERIKFLEDFSKQVESFKKYINDKE